MSCAPSYLLNIWSIHWGKSDEYGSTFMEYAMLVRTPSYEFKKSVKQQVLDVVITTPACFSMLLVAFMFYIMAMTLLWWGSGVRARGWRSSWATCLS